MTGREPSPLAEAGWLGARLDPVREEMFPSGPLELDRILGMYPRTTGEPAFNPALIRSRADALVTRPQVGTGHPFLDLSVRTALAHVDATFQGDHPKYGVKEYGEGRHDSFPPTIVAAADALSAWGLHERAAQLLRHWLLNFVREDGTIDYYGTSVSEYGQLLCTAALVRERADAAGATSAGRGGQAGWWRECFVRLDGMAGLLVRLREEAEEKDGLIAGSPEADLSHEIGRYFHNNAWAAKGLLRWADVCERPPAPPATPPGKLREKASALAADTLAAIGRTWPEDPEDWWLPAQVEPVERPDSLTATQAASYANYRYWPELLSSGILPRDMANRLVEARLSAGGQFCGMTRFGDWLDDWPLADHLYGLWSLGRRNDFLLCLYGHVAYHQAEGHLTAYEQVTFPPGREKAAYCLPCQLVVARAARLLV